MVLTTSGECEVLDESVPDGLLVSVTLYECVPVALEKLVPVPVGVPVAVQLAVAVRLTVLGGVPLGVAVIEDVVVRLTVLGGVPLVPTHLSVAIAAGVTEILVNES